MMAVDEAVLAGLKSAVFDPERKGSKYSHLETVLGKMIAGKRLLPGVKLPADKIFADHIGVSLGTVQKALASLHKKGLVTRAPRRGTVIAERQVDATDVFVFRFRDGESGALILPKVRTISVSACTCDGPWKDFLNSDRLVCVERLMQISIEPPVYSQVFIPYEHGASLLGQPVDVFAGFSVHRHVEHCHGVAIVRCESTVRLGRFEGRAAQQITLEEGTPSLIWESSSFSVCDHPASFQRIQIPPNHRPLEFRRVYQSTPINTINE